jgi:hypothetical protein
LHFISIQLITLQIGQLKRAKRKRDEMQGVLTAQRKAAAHKHDKDHEKKH